VSFATALSYASRDFFDELLSKGSEYALDGLYGAHGISGSTIVLSVARAARSSLNSSANSLYDKSFSPYSS